MRQIDQPKASVLRIIEIYRRSVDDRTEVRASVDVQLRRRLVDDGLLEATPGRYPYFRPTPEGRIALGRAETVERAVDVFVWIIDEYGQSFGRLLADLRGVGPGEDAEGVWSVPVEWTIGPRANTRSFVPAAKLRPAVKEEGR
jgi:hypothetical protein